MTTQASEQAAVGGMLDRMEELRTIDAPALIAAVRTAINSGALKLHTLSAIRRGLAAVAPAVELVGARDERGTRSVQRVGRRHQPWSVEKPRASGMWWWWSLDPEHEPEMVEVRCDEVLRWMGLGPTMHWPGLTRVRNVMAAGGVWAGPVEPPETPSAAVPPTAALSDGANVEKP